jgi:hypothetical protein
MVVPAKDNLPPSAGDPACLHESQPLTFEKRSANLKFGVCKLSVWELIREKVFFFGLRGLA